MHISTLEAVRKTEVKMEGAAGVYKQIPISKEDGTPTFSFRVFTIQPGGHTPLHHHPFEHLNYIIEGSGVIMADGGERRVKANDFALVLPNETHQFRNTSTTEPFVMICAVPKEYE